MRDITTLLKAAREGDAGASNELLPLVYEELRRLAASRLADERPGQTLEATALVHEAYLRLAGPEGDGNSDNLWSGRGHFFAAAAEAMRRILIESARRKQSQKRGGHRQRLTLDSGALVSSEPDEDVLALDEALRRLESEQPVKAQLVKLRYFAGLTQAQAAQSLGISVTTADRYWAYARAWLHQEIFGDGDK
jgi:RNA polymerase sigma factor (TIGR02999 family)